MPKKTNIKNDLLSIELEHEELEEVSQEKVTLAGTDTKLAVAQRMIRKMRDQLQTLERLLTSDAEMGDIEEFFKQGNAEDEMSVMSDGKVIEGVFDGQQMIGADGRTYVVPQNYASKSKLVEGDLLKLNIQPNGGFLFKQIGPIERDRLIGTLIRDENTQEWKVVADGKKYHVLSASVSYFKGEPSDQVVIFIPKAAPSRWAAVENIIHQE